MNTNSFHLYDPQVHESVTKESRRVMVDAIMSINEILAGGCKPGQMVVLYSKGNSGKSIIRELIQKQLSNENDDGQ